MIAIPTSVSALERAALLRLADGRRVVEAGSLLGATTIALARVAASVTSLDRHEGYGPSTWRPFRSNLVRFGAEHVRALKGDAAQLLADLAADLVFVDLTGAHAVTQAAIEAAPAGAIVCVHDFGRQACAGVEAAIAAAGRRVAYVVDTLAVLA